MRRVASSFVLALAIVTDHASAALPSGSTPSATRPAPQVDLGYAVYEGVYNETYNLNTWKR